jgi:hypothetical protein
VIIRKLISPSRLLAFSNPSGQEMPILLWNQKVNYSVYTKLPPVPVFITAPPPPPPPLTLLPSSVCSYSLLKSTQLPPQFSPKCRHYRGDEQVVHTTKIIILVCIKSISICIPSSAFLGNWFPTSGRDQQVTRHCILQKQEFWGTSQRQIEKAHNCTHFEGQATSTLYVHYFLMLL